MLFSFNILLCVDAEANLVDISEQVLSFPARIFKSTDTIRVHRLVMIVLLEHRALPNLAFAHDARILNLSPVSLRKVLNLVKDVSDVQIRKDNQAAEHADSTTIAV